MFQFILLKEEHLQKSKCYLNKKWVLTNFVWAVVDNSKQMHQVRKKNPQKDRKEMSFCPVMQFFFLFKRFKVALSNRRDFFQTQQLLVEINILNISQACTYPK